MEPSVLIAELGRKYPWLEEEIRGIPERVDDLVKEKYALEKGINDLYYTLAESQKEFEKAKQDIEKWKATTDILNTLSKNIEKFEQEFKGIATTVRVERKELAGELLNTHKDIEFGRHVEESLEAELRPLEGMPSIRKAGVIVTEKLTSMGKAVEIKDQLTRIDTQVREELKEEIKEETAQLRPLPKKAEENV